MNITITYDDCMDIVRDSIAARLSGLSVQKSNITVLPPLSSVGNPSAELPPAARDAAAKPNVLPDYSALRQLKTKKTSANRSGNETVADVLIELWRTVDILRAIAETCAASDGEKRNLYLSIFTRMRSNAVGPYGSHSFRAHDVFRNVVSRMVFDFNAEKSANDAAFNSIAAPVLAHLDPASHPELFRACAMTHKIHMDANCRKSKLHKPNPVPVVSHDSGNVFAFLVK